MGPPYLTLWLRDLVLRCKFKKVSLSPHAMPGGSLCGSCSKTCGSKSNLRNTWSISVKTETVKSATFSWSATITTSSFSVFPSIRVTTLFTTCGIRLWVSLPTKSLQRLSWERAPFHNRSSNCPSLTISCSSWSFCSSLASRSVSQTLIPGPGLNTLISLLATTQLWSPTLSPQLFAVSLSSFAPIFFSSKRPLSQICPMIITQRTSLRAMVTKMDNKVTKMINKVTKMINKKLSTWSWTWSVLPLPLSLLPSCSLPARSLPQPRRKTRLSWCILRTPWIEFKEHKNNEKGFKLYIQSTALSKAS